MSLSSVRITLCSLLALAFVMGCSPAQNEVRSSTPDTAAIIGGEKVEKDDPIALSTARIKLEGEETSERNEHIILDSYCTGVLIAPNLVLTAAHCFEVGDSSRIAQLKFFARSAGSAKVKQVIIHPNRKAHDNTVGDSYDLAVVLLSKNAKKVVPAPIFAATEPDPIAKDSLILAGFGQDRVTNPMPENYRLGKNGEGKFRKSKATFINRVGENHTSIFMTSEGSHPCHGDSGGPVFVEKDGVLQLYAIMKRVTDGRTCSGGTYATVVSSHKDWINAMIEWAATQVPQKK